MIKTAAAALALSAAGTALAGTVVVRSTGPSARDYPPGKSISAARDTLKAGDTIVLLDGKGTRTLSGPGSFALNAAQSASTPPPSALMALIQNAGSRQVRTGAVRGTGNAQPRSPSLWYVDTAKSGTMCVTDTSRAMLWRKGSDMPVMLTLARVSDGKKMPISFAAGQAVRAWPVNDLTITENTEYRVSGAGLAKPTSIRFAVITPSDTVDGLAQTLIAKGCTAQVDLLVETANSANAGASAGGE